MSIKFVQARHCERDMEGLRRCKSDKTISNQGTLTVGDKGRAMHRSTLYRENFNQCSIFNRLTCQRDAIRRDATRRDVMQHAEALHIEYMFGRILIQAKMDVSYRIKNVYH